MNARRIYRCLLQALLLLILLISTVGNLRTAKAGDSVAGADMSRIQPVELPNKVFLPCILKPCQPTFFDDFDNPSSGWDIYDNHNPPINVDYSNGEYIMDISGPQIEGDFIFAIGSNPSVFGSVYKVMVSVWINQAPTDGWYPQYGLIFDRDSDGNRFYSFEIVSNGNWYLWKYDSIDNPDDPWGIPKAFGNSDKINQGTALNRLGVERTGSSIALYINGNNILYENSEFPSNGVVDGFIGMIAENSSPKVSRTYYFDNFGLFPVTCDWSSIFNGSFTPTPITQLQALPALTPLFGQIAPKPSK